MVGEIEFRVRTANSIVAFAAYGGCALTIDEDGSDIRALENVAFDAQNRELLTRNTETGRSLSELARLHLQESDVVGTNFAGNFHAVIDRHWLSPICQTDPPREEGLIFSLSAKEKDARILKKEISFLRKEN